MKTKIILRKLIFLFIIVSVAWPFYIDFRISDNVGINPQRIILLLIIIIEIFVIALSGRLKGYNKLKPSWFIFLTLFIFYRLFVSIYLNDNYSLVLSIYEVVSIFILTLVCSKYLNYNDFFIIGKLFYLLSFYLFIVVIHEYISGKNIFSYINSESGKAARGAMVIMVREGISRVKGTFENALTLMQYLLVSFPFSVLYIRSSSKNRKIKFIVSSGLHITMMLLTFSRFGIIMLSIEMIYVVYFSINSKYNRVSVLFLGLLLSLPIYLLLSSTLFEKNDIDLGTGSTGSIFSSQERVGQLVAAGALFYQHPFIGYGLGSAGSVLYDYSQNSTKEYRLHFESVDNRFISVLIESGIFSAIFFLLIFLVSLLNAYSFPEKDIGRYLFLVNGVIFLSLFILSIFTLYSLFFIIMAISNKKKYFLD